MTWLDELMTLAVPYPGPDAWNLITRTLDEKDEDDPLYLDAIITLDDALSDWPPELREAPCAWWNKARQADPPLAWELVRSLTLERVTLDATLCVFGTTAHLTHLSLKECFIQSPEGFRRWLHFHKGWRLKSLNLQEMDLSRKDIQHIAPELAHFELDTLKVSGNDLSAGALSTLLDNISGPGLTTLEAIDCDFCPTILEKIINYPKLQSIERLHLNCYDSHLYGVVTLPFKWGQIRELALPRCELTAETLQDWAGTDFWQTLESLDLSDNPLGTLNRLFSDTPPSALRHLNLARCDLSKNALKKIDFSSLSSLESLDLSGIKGDSRNLWSLLHALLPEGHSMQTLRLQLWSLGGANFEALRVRLSGLKNLHLGECGCPCGFLGLLIRRDHVLETLNLSSNGWTADALRSALDELQAASAFPAPHRNLERAVLDDNPIGNEGLQIMAATGALSGIRRLSIRSSQIGAAGVRVLLSAADLGSLIELDLSNNPLGDEGARHIARSSEELGSLETLHLNHCSITNVGYRALMASSLSSRLRWLDVERNAITKSGLEATSNTIERLGFSGNPLGEEEFRWLSSIPRPSRLVVLSLENDQISSESYQRLHKKFLIRR